MSRSTKFFSVLADELEDAAGNEEFVDTRGGISNRLAFVDGQLLGLPDELAAPARSLVGAARDILHAARGGEDSKILRARASAAAQTWRGAVRDQAR
jgi:hypothetical protein